MWPTGFESACSAGDGDGDVERGVDGDRNHAQRTAGDFLRFARFYGMFQRISYERLPIADCTHLPYDSGSEYENEMIIRNLKIES